jgi:maleate isomerase
MAATLGIVLPDDGPQDYEWYGLDGWLAARSRTDVRVRVAGSLCDGMHTVESLFETGARARLSGPARKLAEAGAGAIVWACTSGSFIGGLDWARAQAAALADDTGLPASSTALALIDAIAALDATRVDLMSPYPGEVTERLVAFLAEAGIATAELQILDCLRSADSHVLDLTAALRRMPASTRPLVIPDTAVNTLGRVAELEALAGRPLVTANQATLHRGLRMLGLPAHLVGAGYLFADTESMNEKGSA